MKTLFILTLLLSPSLYAGNYTKLISCDGGAMVLDAYSYDGDTEQYQVVIRDPRIVSYFQDKGFIGNKPSSSGELIYNSLIQLKFDEPNRYFSRGPTWLIVAERSGDTLTFAVSGNRGNYAQWLFRNCTR